MYGGMYYTVIIVSLKTQWIHCIKMWNFERWVFEHQSLGNNEPLLPHPLCIDGGYQEPCIGVYQNPAWSQPLPLFPVGSYSERRPLLVQILGQDSKTCHKHHTSKKSNFGQESIQVCKYLARAREAGKSFYYMRLPSEEWGGWGYLNHCGQGMAHFYAWEDEGNVVPNLLLFSRWKLGSRDLGLRTTVLSQISDCYLELQLHSTQ